jgi:DNA-binding response OmpR family regulator
MTTTTPGSTTPPRPPALNRTRTILVADENHDARTFLADNLTADGYRAPCTDSRAGALAILTADRVDLVIADLTGNTLALIDTIRRDDDPHAGFDPHIPVIALSTQTDPVHRTRLLDRGGDDVIAKPFSYPELCARIHAVLRRTDRWPAPEPLEIGPLTIDPAARTVRVDGRLVELTGKERALLSTLASDPTRVFTRAELLRTVWDMHTPSRTVDAHACRLRRKLAGAGHLIQNVWGVGLRLTDDLEVQQTRLRP